jgi:small subunit ribosomal protein S4
MGDPVKNRRKYDTPSHPWKRARIESESALKRSYGLKTKREIWKVQTKVRHMRARARGLIAARGEQAERLARELRATAYQLGLVAAEATTDDILALTTENLMDRRLQTVVYKRGMARSMKQARQFIGHGHITLRGRRITSPGYLVRRDDEDKLAFHGASSLSSPDHPERVILARPEAAPPPAAPETPAPLKEVR